MIAGLPGTGIGGLFYVITALGTPFRAWRARREGRAGGAELGAWGVGRLAAGLGGVGRGRRWALRLPPRPPAPRGARRDGCRPDRGPPAEPDPDRLAPARGRHA